MGQSVSGQSVHQPHTERGEIDLIALFREVGRRKWRILAITLGAFILTSIIVNVLKPRYTGETRIFLENRDTEYTRIGREGSAGREPPIDQDAIQSQVLIIQSRDIARNVIKKLGLASKEEFDSTLSGLDIPVKVGVMLGLLTNPASISPEERVLESYADKLKVLAVSKSRVIAIEFTSKDPALAAQVSTAIAEEYINHLEQAKRGSARSAGSWLSATIEPLRQRVAAAEAKVEAFRSQNGLFQVGRDSLTTISTQQLSELNTQLATARSQQSDLNSKARLLREAVRQGRIFEISEVVNNDVVRRLLETRANLRAQIAQEEQTLLPQHPRIKELRAQLTGLEEQIRASAERTARTLENDARAAGGRVVAVQAEMDLQKKQNGSASEQDVQLRALEREAKSERDQLENYLARYRDANSREADNSVAADARVVSKAIVPTNPSFPKKLPMILIATLGAFALSLFATLMKALLSENVYARRAIESPMHHNVSYPVMPPQMMAMYPGMMPNPQFAGMQPVSPMPPAPPVQPIIRAAVSQNEYVAPAPSPEPARASARVAPVPVHAAAPIHSGPTPVSNNEVFPASHSLNLNPQERMSRAMREAFDRTSLSLNNQPIEPSKDSVASNGVSQSHAGEMLSAAYTPAVPSHSGVMGSEAHSTGEVYPSLAEIDAYNPLQEIADAAKMLLTKGRPVSILILSVESVGHGAGTVSSLEQMLSKNGSALAAVLEPELITQSGLLAATASLKDAMDFVIFNGGKVSVQSRNLFEAVNMVVLVASDDLEDPRVDAAEEFLAGSDYFIVSEEPTKPLARV